MTRTTIEKFSPTLTVKKVELFTAADVVRHSFIVQNTITPLNLELSRNYELGNCVRTRRYYPSFSHSKEMVNTKEKCDKIHGNRQLLHNLHLDTLIARESSMKTDSKRRYTFAIPFVELYLQNYFYTHKLIQFFEYACKKNYDKLKILKWLIEFDAANPFKFPPLFQTPEPIATCIADCSSPRIIDTRFVNECFKRVHFSNWIRSNSPERLTNLLYQVHRTGKKPEIMEWCSRLTVCCFFDASCRYIREVLKFLDAPKFCDPFKCHWLLVLMFEIRAPRNYRPFLLLTGNKRCIMMLLLLWFYSKRWRNPSAAADAVRLVWNSFSGSFLSSQEMTAVYGEIQMPPEEIENVYNFYCQAVGKVDSSEMPRSLQHYCRMAIRRTLWENNQWLPDGIAQTGKQMNSYTNYPDPVAKGALMHMLERNISELEKNSKETAESILHASSQGKAISQLAKEPECNAPPRLLPHWKAVRVIRRFPPYFSALGRINTAAPVDLQISSKNNLTPHSCKTSFDQWTYSRSRDECA